jgi:hypothetical protein
MGLGVTAYSMPTKIHEEVQSYYYSYTCILLTRARVSFGPLST